ncbi:MAG: hypothetical protein ACYDBL_12775 [Candidatus Acidiferrales bacterium]
MDIENPNFLFEAVFGKLDAEDDPVLWRAALTVLKDEFLAQYKEGRGRNWVFAVGRCSHWVRPSQSRWTAAGGFAFPEGYRNSHPEFDWSVIFRLQERRWLALEKFSGKRQTSFRAAVPARTARHKQAAVHAKWSNAQGPVFYGFRNQNGHWKCVAVSDERLRGPV